MTPAPKSRPASPRPVTPQRVRAVLVAAGMRESDYEPPDRLCPVGVWSTGFQITGGEDNGPIRVTFNSNDYSVGEETSEWVAGAMAAFLTAAGLACEVREGAVWVRADQRDGGEE